MNTPIAVQFEALTKHGIDSADFALMKGMARETSIDPDRYFEFLPGRWWGILGQDYTVMENTYFGGTEPLVRVSPSEQLVIEFSEALRELQGQL